MNQRTSRQIQGTSDFPTFENAGRENCVCQYGGTECSERGLVPSRKTDRLHDQLLLPGYWRS